MNNEFKLVRVAYLNQSNWKFSLNHTYLYRIPLNFNVPNYLMLCSSVQNKDMDLKFPIVKVLQVIEPKVRLEGTADLTTENPEFESEKESAVKPFYVTEIKGIEKYLESIYKQYELLELEAEMDKAAAKVEKYTKYKAMAELNPEFKEKLERYNELMGFSQIKTIDSVVEDSKED